MTLKVEHFETVLDALEHLNGPDHREAKEATDFVFPTTEMFTLRDLNYWHEWVHEQDEARAEVKS